MTKKKKLIEVDAFILRITYVHIYSHELYMAKSKIGVDKTNWEGKKSTDVCMCNIILLWIVFVTLVYSDKNKSALHNHQGIIPQFILPLSDFSGISGNSTITNKDKKELKFEKFPWSIVESRSVVQTKNVPSPHATFY